MPPPAPQGPRTKLQRNWLSSRVLLGKRRSPGECRRVRGLLRLGRAEFGRLAWADRKVIVASALGEVASFADVMGQTPNAGQQWYRAIECERATAKVNDARDRAEFPIEVCCPAIRREGLLKIEVDPAVIRWLLTDAAALRHVHAAGVKVLFARLTTLLRLRGCSVERDLGLFDCDVSGMLLRGARTKSLYLNGSLVRTAPMSGGSPGAIAADGATVQGGVFFTDGFRAEGEVRLLGARITRDLACRDGSFVRPGGEALNADGVEVGGVVFLTDGFRAEGGVRLLGARITRNLDCTGGSFVHAGGDALNANGARIEGTVFIRGIDQVQGELDFTRAWAGYIADGHARREHWPAQIRLTAFAYDGIHDQSPLDARTRLGWLGKHDDTAKRDRLDPQPYRQLAAVLKKQGHERDAAEVMRVYWCRRTSQEIRRHRRRSATWLGKRLPRRVWRRGMHADRQLYRAFSATCSRGIGLFRWWSGVHPWWVVFWRRLANVTVGHGYNRWRVLVWLAAFWLIGTGVFVYQSGRRMQPAQMLALKEFDSAGTQRVPGTDVSPIEGKYPRFKPALYSLDTLIPLVGFHQEDYWTPRSDPGAKTLWGKLTSGRWWTKMYLAVHIAVGWVLATLFAVSFTKIMRSD